MQLTRHEVSTIRTALHTERRAGEIAESRMAELEDWLASLQMPSGLTPPNGASVTPDEYLELHIYRALAVLPQYQVMDYVTLAAVAHHLTAALEVLQEVRRDQPTKESK